MMIMDCGRCSLFAAGCALCAGLMAHSEGHAKTTWPDYGPDPEAPRERVPAQFRWSLEHFFDSYEQWEKNFKEVEEAVADLQRCKGVLGEDPATLRKCLDDIYDVSLRVEALYAFASADFSTDRTRPEAKVRSDRAQAMVTRFSEAVSFVEPELLAMAPERLRELSVGDAGLKKYSHYFDDLLRRRPHVLGLKEERLLAMTGNLRAGPRFMVNALEEDVRFPLVRDESGKEIRLTRALFPRLRVSTDRGVRKGAVHAFFKTLHEFGSSFAASLDMAVKGNIMVAKARGYGSALEASLDRNAVPTAVYDTLVRATRDALPRTLHRYVALRKRVLGYEDIHYYDLYTPMFPSVKKEIPYAKALELVKEALKPLGPGYMKVLERGLDPASKWVDVYPNKGKRSGAYCNGVYGRHPIVFLNYMGELDDVFTLIHEFGHALHFHLTFEAQEYVNSDTPIFLAEIASTFNEEMLLDHLLEKAGSKKEKLYLLNKRLENIRTTIIRQVMFAEFERAIHHEVESGGALTSERMAEIYGGLVRDYYGPDFTMDPDDAWEWAYIPHFYYNFYVYQYATGLMSAIALSRKVLAGEDGAVERYLDFLRAGGSDYPVAVLQRAGVDLTRRDAMDAAFDLFAQTMDRIEELLDED